MKLYVNRRIRDKAMVLGLPAESFLACLGLACSPVLIVVFLPVFIVVGVRGLLALSQYGSSET